MADPLSILGAVETCFSISKEIWDIAMDIKNMSSDHAELDLDFEYDSILLKKFIEFFKSYQDDLDSEIRNHLIRLTTALNTRLAELKTEIAKRSKKDIRDHLLWPFVKKSLVDSQRYLERWVAKVNQIMSNLPNILRDHLLDSFAATDYKNRANPLSPLVAAKSMQKLLEDSANEQEIEKQVSEFKDNNLVNRDPENYFDPDIARVPEYFWHRPEVQKQVSRSVAKLVAVLSHAETDKMHILKASKYFEEYTGESNKRVVFQYGIVYEKPRGITQVLKMKDFLQSKNLVNLPDGRPRLFSLSERVRVATEISSAIAYIHAIGWLHELIRSEHVLLCYDLDGPILEDGSLGVARICGFDAAREAKGQYVSHGIVDGDWRHELYCHPERQQKNMTSKTPHPTDVRRFKVKHDVYSLGVVLLELGLWRDLESIMKPADPTTSVTKPKNPPTPVFQFAEPENRKKKLEEFAETLSPMVGSVYEQLVTDCLGAKESGPTMAKIWEDLDVLRI